MLSATLLGLAGFGEYQGPNRPHRTLAKLGPPLDAAQWRLFRVRPSNHPRRRVAGAAGLLTRFATVGLLAGLASAAAQGNPSALTRALSVSSAVEHEAALIGPGRAGDIAVNAVLPFLHGLASLAGEAGKSREMLELYRKYGKLTENEITRELASALQPSEWGPVARTARQQQGLIHLQRLLAGASNAPR